MSAADTKLLHQIRPLGSGWICVVCGEQKKSPPQFTAKCLAQEHKTAFDDLFGGLGFDYFNIARPQC